MMLEYFGNTNYLDYAKGKNWIVTIKINPPYKLLSIEGQGIIDKGGSPKQISITLPNIDHGILTISDDRIDIKTMAGNKVPIYSRVTDNILILSNLAYLLIKNGETLRLSGPVIAQQLRGMDFPQKNIFMDIGLLDASSHYIIKNKNIFYHKSLLFPQQNIKKEDIFEDIHNNFIHFMKSGKPIAVLLSGGYDSRLNLAFVEHYSKKYGNEIFAYHEYKDDKEY